MSKKNLLFLSGSILFLLFVFFSYLVHEDLFTNFDFNSTVRLQDNIGRNWDQEFSLLSDIGKFEVSSIIVFGIMLLLFFKKKFLGAMTMGVLYVGFHIIELFGKFFVDHPPPPQFMLRMEQILHFPQFHVRSEYSYPSGHSGRTIFISAVLLIIIWQTKKLPTIAKFGLTGLLVGYDIAMLVSRVTLGEHWSTDVIGGAILGLAFGLLTGGFLITNKQKKQADQPEENRTGLFPKYKIEIKKVE